MSNAEHLAPAVRVDVDRDDHRDRDDAMVAAHLHVGGVEPDIRPVALQRPVEERFDLVVDLLAQPADLALRNARSAHGLDEVVDRAGRDALHVGFLDHGAQRLLRHPPRLEEARKVRALAQLGDAQFDRASPRLPIPVAIAVALGEPLRRTLAMRRAGSDADLNLHQPLGGEGDHVAKNVGVGGLLHQRAKVHHIVGHRRFLGLRLRFATQTLPKNRRWPPQAARSLRRYEKRASQTACSRRDTPPSGTRPRFA